ncbi:hypothetical protein RHGRI_025542 [Rhododendron griersonianum]|uniref:Uncharacterized protein n=1 Tax=Rhododendron griersonianum TaxID=479676 RepID=A0AAV6IPJ0_9ERIC|nr:hypothetical protein RHGRI_025542 [Rhododendron griersonianum]
MGSLEQVNGESNPMAAFDVKKETPTNNTHEDFDLENQKHKKPGWRKFLAYVGPGFLVSLAYLDPGNLETDLQAGANDGFELLWVILVGMIFALIIQSLAANLGVSTVIGTAFGLNILFHIPVWAGVLLTGLSTLLLIGLQRYGIRKLELLIAIMVFTMAACFFVEMGLVKPPASDMLEGLFVPKLSGSSATGDAIALLGALIMPHNLFLHSALDVCRYYLMETGFALFVALLINISVISVSATVCSDPSVSDQCNNITLNSASFLLKMVLSFELPFSLIPLLKFSSSTSKMGPYKGSIYIIAISWILGLAIMGANIYYLSTSFVGWVIHSTLPKVATVFIAIIVFPIMVVYVASVIYLMWRKDTVVTYIDTMKNDPAVQSGTEDGEDSIVPFREDLADIPLPE